MLFNICDLAFLVFYSGYSVSREPTLHWLDYATIKVGGRFSHAEVQEAKSFFKIFAIFLSFIPYWICNAQVGL